MNDGFQEIDITHYEGFVFAEEDSSVHSYICCAAYKGNLRICRTVSIQAQG